EHVHVPRSVLQPFARRERALGLEQSLVHGVSRIPPASADGAAIRFFVASRGVVERVDRVEQRSEIQLWGCTLALWRRYWIAGIARQLEEALLNLTIALSDLLGAPVAKRLQVLHVTLNGFSQIGKRERQEIS